MMINHGLLRERKFENENPAEILKVGNHEHVDTLICQHRLQKNTVNPNPAKILGGGNHEKNKYVVI